MVNSGPHVRFEEFGDFLDDHDRESQSTGLVWRTQYEGGCSRAPFPAIADFPGTVEPLHPLLPNDPLEDLVPRLFLQLLREMPPGSRPQAPRHRGEVLTGDAGGLQVDSDQIACELPAGRAAQRRAAGNSPDRTKLVKTSSVATRVRARERGNGVSVTPSKLRLHCRLRPRAGR